MVLDAPEVLDGAEVLDCMSLVADTFLPTHAVALADTTWKGCPNNSVNKMSRHVPYLIHTQVEVRMDRFPSTGWDKTLSEYPDPAGKDKLASKLYRI